MCQTFEGPSFVRCADVGLDCGHIIFGDNQEKVMENATTHMFEYHAIYPEEMTTCMRLKIRQNIQSYRNLARAEILQDYSNISENLLPVV